MAVAAYIKIDTVTGNSTSKQNYTDVLSFSFGGSQPTSIAQGQLRAGKADLGQVTITKALDGITPTLFDLMVRGTQVKTAEMVYDKAMQAGGAMESYFKISMEGCMITSQSIAGADENPMETITIAYEKIKIEYNPEKDRKLQGFIGKGYDLLKLVSWS